MRLWMALILASLPASAFAQAGYIGIYSDVGYSDCTLLDQSSGYVDVYVVHKGTSGATGAQFKVAGGAGFNCIYVDETSPHTAVVGNSQTGVGIGYGQCFAADVLVLTITYIRYGGSLPCSYLEAVPDPTYGTGSVAVTDCTLPFAQQLPATGSRLYVNPDESCSCAVATEPTTWGRIKGLYR